MPWKRAKALPPPDNALFDACFRIQREAGGVPLIVENVRGAEKWVGPAAWHFGSYYLWGDVPALMPQTIGQKFNPDGTSHPAGSWFKIADSKNRGIKAALSGRSWFTEDVGAVSSKSIKRKMASAMIAKIPFPLAQHIARCYKL